MLTSVQNICGVALLIASGNLPLAQSYWYLLNNTKTFFIGSFHCKMPSLVDMNCSRAWKPACKTPAWCHKQRFAHNNIWWLMTDGSLQDFGFGSEEFLDFMYKYSYFQMYSWGFLFACLLTMGKSVSVSDFCRSLQCENSHRLLDCVWYGKENISWGNSQTFIDSYKNVLCVLK